MRDNNISRHHCNTIWRSGKKTDKKDFKRKAVLYVEEANYKRNPNRSICSIAQASSSRLQTDVSPRDPLLLRSMIG